MSASCLQCKSTAKWTYYYVAIRLSMPENIMIGFNHWIIFSWLHVNVFK